MPERHGLFGVEPKGSSYIEVIITFGTCIFSFDFGEELILSNCGAREDS